MISTTGQPRQTTLQTTVTPRKHKGDKDKQDAREESELAGKGIFSILVLILASCSLVNGCL